MKIRKKKAESVINLLGLLLALGISLGGLLLVQGRLAREEADILRSGGMITASYVTEDVESQKTGQAEIFRENLSPSQLSDIMEELKNISEVYPHEPKQGQLSMAEAIEYGKSWLEGFFIPHLEEPPAHSREYRANCYLWTPREDVQDNNDDLLLSFWTVHFSSQGIEASLILNAVSGQVLDASVSCSFPMQQQKDINLISFLEDYVNSFGLESPDHILVQYKESSGENDPTLYQILGQENILAAIKAYSILISNANIDSVTEEYTEILNIHLYLTAYSR